MPIDKYILLVYNIIKNKDRQKGEKTMTAIRTEIWKQWEIQEQKRFAKETLAKQLQAYIELNNLYLNIESGKAKMSITNGNILRTLVSQAYFLHDPMITWWGEEFEKLPNWFNY